MFSLVVKLLFACFLQRIVKFYMFYLFFWLLVLFGQVRATKQTKERLQYGDNFVALTEVNELVAGVLHTNLERQRNLRKGKSSEIFKRGRYQADEIVIVF